MPPMERRKGEEYQRMRRKKLDADAALSQRINGNDTDHEEDQQGEDQQGEDQQGEDQHENGNAIEAIETKKKKILPRKYKLGEIVECKLNKWEQYYGGRISRHDVVDYTDNADKADNADNTNNTNNTNTTNNTNNTNKTCNNNHGLICFDTPTGGYNCILCNQSQSISSIMYGCEECNYDICQNCSKENNNASKKKTSATQILTVRYSILFDDLSMQSELKSRVHRRVVEGISENQIRKMPRRRLELYEQQYDVYYGIRKTKEDIEMLHQQEKDTLKPKYKFFGKVNDVFEAKLPHWNTWYAGRLTHKDAVIGTVSMQFDDVRLLANSTAILEANEDHKSNPKKIHIDIHDRPKWNRVVEDIPHENVRPITTGRLRLYVENQKS